jgi:hypothetical protein
VNGADQAARALATMPPAAFIVALAQAAGGRGVVIRSARPNAATWSDGDTLPAARGRREAPIQLHAIEDDPLPGQGVSLGPDHASAMVRNVIQNARAMVINGCSEAFNPAALLLAVQGGRIHGGAVVIQCAAQTFAAWMRAADAWAPDAERMPIAPTDGATGHA